MNQFTEVYRRKSRSMYRRSRRHEWEVAEAQISKGRRLAGRLLLAAAALSAVGYFLATASFTAILVVGILLLALFGGLVVFGLYVLDNVR